MYKKTPIKTKLDWGKQINKKNKIILLLKHGHTKRGDWLGTLGY